MQGAVVCREVSCFLHVIGTLSGDIQNTCGCLANDGEIAGRATGEPIRPRLYAVAKPAGDRQSKAFVLANHSAHSYLPDFITLRYEKHGGLVMAHPFPLFEPIWTPSHDVLVTPEITSAIAAGAAVAIGVSGGKDSAATALAAIDCLEDVGQAVIVAKTRARCREAEEAEIPHHLLYRGLAENDPYSSRSFAAVRCPPGGRPCPET